MRFNNAGTFELPATRVEVLYAPEMFGERPNETRGTRSGLCPEAGRPSPWEIMSGFILTIPASTPSTRSIGMAVGPAKANPP